MIAKRHQYFTYKCKKATNVAKMYLLPKTHKMSIGVPGRPLITNCGRSIGKISEILKHHLKPSKTGLFEGSFFWLPSFPSTPILHISTRSNLISIELCRIFKQTIKSSLKVKKADIIFCLLTLLDSLQQRNVEKSKKSIKIVNIKRENLHIFRKTWGISMTFSV